MANITESTEVTAVAGTDVLYCVQGSNDRKFTASQLATYINDNIVCNSFLDEWQLAAQSDCAYVQVVLSEWGVGWNEQ